MLSVDRISRLDKGSKTDGQVFSSFYNGEIITQLHIACLALLTSHVYCFELLHDWVPLLFALFGDARVWLSWKQVISCVWELKTADWKQNLYPPRVTRRLKRESGKGGITSRVSRPVIDGYEGENGIRGDDGDEIECEEWLIVEWYSSRIYHDFEDRPSINHGEIWEMIYEFY